LIGVAILLVAVVGGPFAYIHLVEGKAPAPLTLASPSSGSSGSSGLSSATAPDGTWKVTTGSVVGYRVNEVLFGQSNVAVGRTGAITGSITVAGTTITAGTITVDMTTLTSDQSRRDEQFNGRIMETSTYPTATLELSDPVTLGSIPAVGAERSVQVTGTLTLHGVTKTVTFSVAGRYQGSTFSVVGSIPITFSDWNIQSPSFGPVTTEDHGTLEFSLVFASA
jgi:polyisoprenoid-binding protein YceI